MRGGPGRAALGVAVATVVAAVVVDAQTSCPESNEFCSCCCYTSISPTLHLFDAGLQIYACHHVNYGLLPCCNPNSDEEPPLPPPIASFPPTHAPTPLPSNAPTESPATVAPDTTTATPDLKIVNEQAKSGKHGKKGKGDNSDQNRVGDEINAKSGKKGKGDDAGQNRVGDDTSGLKGKKGTDSEQNRVGDPVIAVGKAKKGPKVGKIIIGELEPRRPANSSSTVGFFAAGLIGVLALAAFAIYRKSKMAREDAAEEQLLAKNGSRKPRTFTGIFGDIAENPTAGSMLMVDSHEPKIRVSPPRAARGYVNFREVTASSTSVSPSRGHLGSLFRGADITASKPTSTTSTTSAQDLKAQRAQEKWRLLPVNANEKSTMETLRALGLVPDGGRPATGAANFRRN